MHHGNSFHNFFPLIFLLSSALYIASIDWYNYFYYYCFKTILKEFHSCPVSLWQGRWTSQRHTTCSWDTNWWIDKQRLEPNYEIFCVYALLRLKLSRFYFYSDINWNYFDPYILLTCSMDTYINLWDTRYGI